MISNPWSRASGRPGRSEFVFLWLLAAVVAWPPVASAQEVLDLDLSQAVDRAAGNREQVALAEGALREARAARAGAGILLPENPRIYFEGRLETGTHGSKPAGYAASLEAPFEIGGAPGARVKEAESRIASSEIDLARERFFARYQAWSLYVELQLADRRREEAGETILNARRVHEASTARLQAGATSEIDVAIAAASLAEAMAAQEGVIAAREELRFMLLQLLGLPAGTQVRLSSPMGAIPSCLEGVEGSRDQRPELQAIRAQIAEFEATQVRLERELFPRVGIVAGVDGAPDSPAYGQIGLSVELPIARRNQGQRAVVHAALENARLRLAFVERRIEREVAALRATCRARREEALWLGERAVPQAQRALDGVEQGWLAGKYDIFRVTTAARDLARTRSTSLDALVSAWREQIALAQALMKGIP